VKKKAKNRDFISIKDYSSEELKEILDLAKQVKKEKITQRLTSKNIAIIFEKPSTRTKASFEAGMYKLGGDVVVLPPETFEREAIKDVALTMSRYVDGIVLRTFSHNTILDFAKYSSVPVINGLSDLLHPCQALADVLTVEENKGLENTKMAYIGDGNNVCNSLIFACAKLGIDLSVSSPPGYEPKKSILDEAKEISKKAPRIVKDPVEAVKDCDVIYTDVWASMGQEEEAEKRKKAFESFQVNKKLVSQAKKDVIIMHCLPAHRGEEITDEIIDSPLSVVFDQAENRLHAQMAILLYLLKE
jgi:ornithine carbamoyltransferase